MKIRKNLAIHVGGALVALFCIAGLCGLFSFNITMTADDIQSLVNSKIPLHGQSGPLRWEVKSAELKFEEGGIVRVRAKVNGKILSKQTDATIEGTAKPLYYDNAFRIHNMNITNITLVNKNNPTDNLVDGDAKHTRELLRTRLLNAARDAAHGRDLSHQANEINKAIVDALKANSAPIVERIMDDIPLYKTSESSDIRIRMLPVVLTNFTVSENTITATIDPIGGVLRYVFYGIIIILFMAAMAIGFNI